MCRQLGKKGGTPRTYAYYGPGKQGMMVNHINCPTGKEPNITNCYVQVNWSFDPSYIKRSVDWGVECTDPAGGRSGSGENE